MLKHISNLWDTSTVLCTEIIGNNNSSVVAISEIPLAASCDAFRLKLWLYELWIPLLLWNR